MNIPTIDKKYKKIKTAESFSVINETNFKVDDLLKIIKENKLLTIKDDATNKLIIKNESFKNDEEYKLEVKGDNTILYISTYKALTRAFATIIQNNLLETEIEDGHITDKPLYSGRGVSGDISRHFFNKEEIKKELVVFFLYKLNKMQLHLTDDQGGRIEIKSLPLLTEKSSLRYEHGVENGGFLTQDNIKEIVSFAEALGIEVIPEIGMPGHTLGITHSYPELLCEDVKPVDRLEAKGGVSHDVVCISNPKVVEMFKKIIDEVAPLFRTTKYFHIGGDECPPKNGEKCKRCQNLMEEKKYETPGVMQKAFALEIIKHISAKGLKTIVGDDLVDNEQIENVAIECGREGEMKKEGYCDKLFEGDDVEFINMANEHVYLDGYQDENEPRYERYDGGLTPHKKTFDFEPTKYVYNEENKKKIKGSSLGIGTERMDDLQRFEYQVYPRLLIFANNMGSGKKHTGEEFQDILEDHKKILDFLDIYYFKKGDKYLELSDKKIHIMGEEYMEN